MKKLFRLIFVSALATGAILARLDANPWLTVTCFAFAVPAFRWSFTAKEKETEGEKLARKAREDEEFQQRIAVAAEVRRQSFPEEYRRVTGVYPDDPYYSQGATFNAAAGGK